MSEDENVFPMDITDRDPSSRPSKWRPQGYLVTILADAEEAKRAENALVQSGLAPRDVKLYESGEILANHEIYMGRRSAAGKAVGAFVDDAEGRELYLGYAGRSLRDVGPDTERGRCFQGASSACGLRLRARALLRAGYAAGLPYLLSSS
jgi:hypothetical protein